jgi:transposase-like protein
MTTPAPPSYAGYRFPAEIISFAVWLYFRWLLLGSGVVRLGLGSGVDEV